MYTLTDRQMGRQMDGYASRQTVMQAKRHRQKVKCIDKRECAIFDTVFTLHGRALDMYIVYMFINVFHIYTNILNFAFYL